MKLEKLTCPSCGAAIDFEIKGEKTVLCPYCDKLIAIDDGEKVITHNYNKTVDEHIHNEYSDNSKVLKEKRKLEEYRTQINIKKMIVIAILSVIGLGVFGFGSYAVYKKVVMNGAIIIGKIQIGHDAEWFVGKKIQSVEEILKSLGFKNITSIPVDDAGISNWKINWKNTVESISINGSKNFHEDDFFGSNAKIIIYYHD